MIDELHNLLKEQAQDIIANNASTIAQELSENPEGKCAVALSLKLTKLGPTKLHCESTLSFSRKFKDEMEGVADIKDPQQPELDEFGKDAA